jgi:hypothetical protein
VRVMYEMLFGPMWLIGVRLRRPIVGIQVQL